MENVRANRSRPGLLRQHLTALTAITEICAADVSGAKPRSRSVMFEPRGLFPGNYRFSVGTAGSACLVLQTILYPLLFANGPSSVVLEGGTHNAMSPPFHFIERTFLPVLAKMGAEVSVRLDRYGFYPAGGGRIMVAIKPVKKLRPIEILHAGPVVRRQARAVVSRLSPEIGERELAVVRERLGLTPAECSVEKARSAGPGNVLMLHLERANVTETITAFGEKGVPAERVAGKLADEAEAYLAADVPVGEHLADQLIVPLVLARGGAFVTSNLSLHSTTNIDVVEQLTGVRARVDEEGTRTRVSVTDS